jgi:hypothetical protein
MASKGRNGDSMLVHMTPGEVHGLQALAMKHGGSLTINPDTGLPEANFLKSLLPMLAGFALNAFVPGLGAAVGGMFGASAAVGTGIAVGGITGLATGSLSKGLMAGLGAYGGAGLSEGLMGAATTGDAFQAAQSNLGPEANAMSVKDVAATANINPFTTGAEALGTEQGRAAALNAMGGVKGALTTAGAAASPIVADLMVPTTTQAPAAMSPGRIREKRWNGRYFEDVANTDAGVFNTSGRSFSDPYRGYKDGGGIVALADGGAFETATNAYDPTKDNPADAIAKIQAAMDRNKALAAQNLATAQAQPATAVDMASNKGTADAGIAALTPAANAAPVTNTGAAGELAFTSNNVGATPNGGLTNLLANVASNVGNAAGAGNVINAAAAAPQLTPTQAAAEVNDMYRNVLGRDADPVGMSYWTNQIALGVPLDTLFNNFKTSATSNAEIVNSGFSNAAEAMKDYKGYASTEGGTVGDEWVRNVLGRELNADDRSQQWYRDLLDPKIAKDVATTKSIYDDFKAYAASRDPLANTSLNWMAASQLKALPPPVNPTQQATQTVAKAADINTAEAAALPVGVGGSTGPSQIGGGATVNPNGTITSSPRIPGIPVGGFTGMTGVRDAYTTGGGKTGYTSPVPTSLDAFNKTYVTDRMSGDSLAAYEYLTGKKGAAYPVKSSVGQIARPYDEAVLGYPARGNLPYTYNKTTGKMDPNPDYVAPGRDALGNVTYGMSLNDIKQALKDAPLSGQALYDWAKSNKLSAQQISDATGRPLSSVYADFRAGAKAASAAGPTLTEGQTLPFADLYQSVLQRDGDATGLAYWKSQFGDTVDADELAAFKAAARASGELKAANGGVMGHAMGGMPYSGGGLGTLGGYSDGGRLLKGPGDGVSDSIPATIGRKQQPARLADGEFVVPARIVSELGNGSTDAGAKKLYAMMDRVQRARGKTTGKNKVAANSRADQHLPA